MVSAKHQRWLLRMWVTSVTVLQTARPPTPPLPRPLTSIDWLHTPRLRHQITAMRSSLVSCALGRCFVFFFLLPSVWLPHLLLLDWTSGANGPSPRLSVSITMPILVELQRRQPDKGQPCPADATALTASVFTMWI